MLSASHSLHYSDLDNILNQPETEHNWAAKENACKLIGQAAQPGIQHDHDFVVFIKNHRTSLASAIKTERTRLSGTACDMVEKLARAMQSDFGPLLGEVFTGPLLQVCARTNKVMVSRAVKALQSSVDVGSLVCLPKACAEIATPNKSLRIACIGLIARSIDRFSTHDLEPYLAVFEPVLKEGVSDAAPEVRDTSRKSFKAYASKFPERATALMATMPSNVLKYLQPDKSASGTGSATGASTLSRTATGGITKSLPSGGVKASLASRHHSSRDMSLGGASRIGASARPAPMRAASVPAAAAASSDHLAQASSSSSSLRSLKTSNASLSSPLTHHHHHHQQPQQQHYPLHPSHRGQHPSHASSDIPRNSLAERQSSVERTSFRSYGVTAARQPIYEHSESSSFTTSSSSSSSSSSLGISARPLANRSRTLSGNAMTASAMMQRAPAINLAAHGGAQRVAPSGSSNHSSGSSSLGSLSSAIYSTGRTAAKVDSGPRSNRNSVSGGSGHGIAPKERAMSASERAKAYSASLKLEMSQRRANDAKAAALRGRRAATESAEDHCSPPLPPQQQPLSSSSLSQRSSSSMSDSTRTLAREPWQGARSASPQLESYPPSSFDTLLSDPNAVGSVDLRREKSPPVSQQPQLESDQQPPPPSSSSSSLEQQQQQAQQEQHHQHQQEHAAEQHSPPSETKLQDVSMTREHGFLSILTDTHTAKQDMADDRHGPLSGSSSVPSSVTSGSSAGSSCSSPASLTWSVASGILSQVASKTHEGHNSIDAEACARFAKPWPDVDMIPDHSVLFGSTETILRTEAEIAAFHRMQQELAAESYSQPEPEDLFDGAMGPAEMEAYSLAETVSSETDAAAAAAATAAMLLTLESEHGEAHMSDVEQEVEKSSKGDEVVQAMDESMDKGQPILHEIAPQMLREHAVDKVGPTTMVQASAD